MNSQTPSPLELEKHARSYWASQMDEAFGFMEKMRGYPLEECGEEMGSLAEAAASEGLEVVFSETLIDGRHPRIFYVRRGLIPSFQQVAREMNERGWILKVEDGYRTPGMQRALSHVPRNFDTILKKTMWELGGAVPDPALMFRRLSALIATRCRIGTHISGSAIDISVLDRSTGCEIERGGKYIEFSERTPMASPFVTPQEHANRIEIEAVLQRHGWMAYPYEFWHFSNGDSYAETFLNSGKPARYGPVAFDGVAAVPIKDPESDALLEPLEFYQQQISAALERLRQ